MKRGKKWIAVAVALALPATAFAATPAGKYSGELTEFKGSTVTFKVARSGKTLLNFTAHGTYGSLQCYGSPSSATVFLPKAKIKGRSISGQRTHTAAGLKEVDKLTGKFSGKRASGTVDQSFFQGTTDVCGTGKLKWTAKLG
jgi:hypothetical protein